VTCANAKAGTQKTEARSKPFFIEKILSKNNYENNTIQTIIDKTYSFNAGEERSGCRFITTHQVFRKFADMFIPRNSFVIAVLSLFFVGLTLQCAAQTDTTRKVVQVSGMTIDADSLYPIPFVAIIIKGSQRGVYSTGSGYYSIVAQENDTLEFYSLGYKTGTYILPDTFSQSQVNHVQALRMDTILMSEMVVYPWPSRDKFKNSFLALEVPDDDMERARMNLAQQRMMAAATNVSADGQGAYRSAVTQRTDKNYYAGQYQPNNLLNPVAWSKFIQSVRKK
jgi:hypothetical protein